MPLESENTESGSGFAQLATTSIGSDLMSILMADDIVPGSPPSYQLCKTIYTSHPLGQKIAEGPITIAQSQEREIELIDGPKSLLLPAFQAEWKALACDTFIKRVAMLARIYGIATLAIGGDDAEPQEPLDLDNLYRANLSLRAFDPLNTAGSLVLNQDPNATDFQQPTAVRAGSQNWHPSRTVVMLNESPIYIDFTPSAFGFVGRSVYQRALFPLKSYINSIIADDAVLKKIALLIWKSVPPSSATNQRMFQFFGWKRQNLKTAVNGQVLTIGDKEDIQSLNFQNLEGAGRFARENVLKNIAVAAGGMPAALLHMETLTEGFGEGTEDAKQIAAYIDRIRIELDPLYDKLDDICMRRAWSPDFYKGVQREIPELRGVAYEASLRRWMNGFRATWPNLLTEPDSEKSEVAERQFKSVVALIEVLSPLLADPDNKAALVQWAAEQASDNELLFTSPLEIDPEKIRTYKPEIPDDETAEPKPRPFANAT